MIRAAQSGMKTTERAVAINRQTRWHEYGRPASPVSARRLIEAITLPTRARTSSSSSVPRAPHAGKQEHVVQWAAVRADPGSWSVVAICRARSAPACRRARGRQDQASARRKTKTRRADNGAPVHSFQLLLPTSQFVGTPICYANRGLHATARKSDCAGRAIQSRRRGHSVRNRRNRARTQLRIGNHRIHARRE
jgi:hypothetical protein